MVPARPAPIIPILLSSESSDWSMFLTIFYTKRVNLVFYIYTSSTKRKKWYYFCRNRTHCVYRWTSWLNGRKLFYLRLVLCMFVRASIISKLHVPRPFVHLAVSFFLNYRMTLDLLASIARKRSHSKSQTAASWSRLKAEAHWLSSELRHREG